MEIGKSFARALGVESGDKLTLSSPYFDEGLPATALVTQRIGAFERDGALYNVASVTLYGHDDAGANALTPPAFDFFTGGMEIKVFMGKIVKA